MEEKNIQTAGRVHLRLDRSDFGDNLMALIDDMNAIGAVITFDNLGKCLYIDISRISEALGNRRVACDMIGLYIDKFKMRN